jgi:choline dehydrogenase-like flavoprotein
VNRRDLLKAAALLGTAGTRAFAGQPADSDPDYIVVGSGAGGGTVAARLAEAGFTVTVLEAGGDVAANGSANYQVPAFHPFATEDPEMRWDFFVRHYQDLTRQQRDPKFLPERDGVWYPRAGTLGGCTAHNALIFVYPSNSDWDAIADLTGDPSWRGAEMWKYVELVEDCHHRPFERLWHDVGINPTRHGWSGWLRTETFAPKEAIADDQLRKVIAQSVNNVMKEFGAPSLSRLEALGDPNDWRVVSTDDIGPRYTPMTAINRTRTGSRERLLSVAAKRPDLLKIELHALATRVLLNDDNTRAIGVEYQRGERLYAADPGARTAAAETRRLRARREVILAGGAFNTPQLLMLSGIGDPDVLRRAGVEPRVALPAVGCNLQDRYEVAVVSRMRKNWDMLEGATFTTEDRQYREWQEHRRGIYATNGVLLALIQRSSVGKPVPDLFCYAVLADFRGYKPRYSDAIRARHNMLSWVVLKGHTNNRGGRVTLTSSDPRARPAINFHYFEEGTDASDDDLQSVVEGIRLVRRIAAGLGDVVEVEESPGPDVVSDEDLQRFARDHAWGHHASCTCAIGPRHLGGVLTSDFQVHGVERLRVVDASVFPRTPGLFIVSAVYMIGEKAAEVIARDARHG